VKGEVGGNKGSVNPKNGTLVTPVTVYPSFPQLSYNQCWGDSSSLKNHWFWSFENSRMKEPLGNSRIKEPLEENPESKNRQFQPFQKP
jgi:hypothetical protein